MGSQAPSSLIGTKLQMAPLLDRLGHWMRNGQDCWRGRGGPIEFGHAANKKERKKRSVASWPCWETPVAPTRAQRSTTGTEFHIWPAIPPFPLVDRQSPAARAWPEI